MNSSEAPALPPVFVLRVRFSAATAGGESIRHAIGAVAQNTTPVPDLDVKHASTFPLEYSTKVK
jgi:hypothetical protein